MKRLQLFVLSVGLLAAAAFAVQALARRGLMVLRRGMAAAPAVPAGRASRGGPGGPGWTRWRVPPPSAVRGREAETHARTTGTDHRAGKRDEGQAREDPHARAEEDPGSGPPAASRSRRPRQGRVVVGVVRAALAPVRMADLTIRATNPIPAGLRGRPTPATEAERRVPRPAGGGLLCAAANRYQARSAS